MHKNNSNSAVPAPACDYAGIFEAAPAPMWIYEPRTLAFLKVNRAAVEQYGYSEEDFLGMKLTDLCTRQAVVSEKTEGGTDCTLEGYVRHVTRCGEVKEVVAKASPILFEEKQAALAVITDLTDDHRMQVERSAKFLSVLSEAGTILTNSDNWTGALHRCFALIGETLRVDRVYYFENNLEDDTTSQRVEWSRENVEPQIDNPGLQNVPLATAADFVDPLRNDQAFAAIIDQMRPGTTRDLFAAQGIRSILVLPVFVRGAFHGFIGFDDCRLQRQWLPDEVQFLRALTSNISGMLETSEANRELEMSVRRFRSLVQKGTDLIAVIDSNGIYSYVSTSAESVLGYPPESLLGKCALDFIHPEDVRKVAELLVLVVDEQTTALPPFRFKSGDSQWRWVQTTLTNLLNDEAVGGIVANSRDITDSLQTEEELRLANERYRIASIATQDHIYDWNIETGEVARSGESLEKLFGYPSAGKEIHNSDFWREKVHPDDCDRVYDEINGCIENLADSWEQQYRFGKADGMYATVIDKGQIIRGKKGKALRIVGAVRDISATVIKKQEQKLLLLLSNAIGKPGSLSSCLSDALQELLAYSGLAACEMWLKSYDGQRLNLVSHATGAAAAEQFYSSGVTSFAKGEGLPGHIWQSGHPAFWDNIDEDKRFIRAEAAAKVGVRSGFGIPIFYNDEFLGALLLLSRRPASEMTFQSDLLSNMGRAVGPVLKQKMTEEELEKFFKLSPDLLCIAGLDGYFKKVNRAFTDILGYTEAELLSKPITSLVYDEDLEKVRTYLQKLDQGEPQAPLRVRFTTKSDDIKWITWSSRLARKEQLRYSVGKDITAQREAETALGKAYDRLRKAQEIAKLGYWSRKVGEDVNDWSEETYSIFGRSPEDFIPTMANMRECVHPEDRHLTDMSLTDIFGKGKQRDLSHRIITGAGEMRWVYQRMTLVSDESGEPVLLEGIIQDITEQKEVEDALRLSKEGFEIAMKASSEVIWDWDHQTNMVTRSTGYMEKIDYEATEEGTMSGSWFGKIHPGDVEAVRDSFEEALASGSSNRWEFEYRILNRNGEYNYVVDRGFVIRNKEQRPLRSIGAVQDVTESRRYLERIKKKNEALREIAWLQSHVVRAPLARIMGLVHVIQDYKNGQQSIDELCELIMQSANELDEVIKDVSRRTDTVDKSG